MPDYNDRYVPPSENRPAHPSLRKNIVNGYNTFFCVNDNIVAIYLNIPYSILTYDLLVELGTRSSIDRDDPPDFTTGETVTIERQTIRPGWANTGRNGDARYIGDIMNDPEFLPLLPSAFVEKYDKSTDDQYDRSKVSTNYKQAAGFYYGTLIPVDCDYPAVHMRNCLPIIYREQDADLSLLDDERQSIERMNTYLTAVSISLTVLARHALTKTYGMAGSDAFETSSFPHVDSNYNTLGTYTLTIEHLTDPARRIENTSLLDIVLTYENVSGVAETPPSTDRIPELTNITGNHTLEEFASFCRNWEQQIIAAKNESEERVEEYIEEANRIYNETALSSLSDELKFLQSIAKLHDVALTDSSTARGGMALSNMIAAEDNKSIMQSSYPTRLGEAAERNNVTIFPDRMEIFRHGALYVVTVDAGDPTGRTITRLHLVRSGNDTAVMSDFDVNEDQTITYSALPPVMEVISQPISLGVTSGVNILRLFERADNEMRQLPGNMRRELNNADFDATYLFGDIDVLLLKSGLQGTDTNTLYSTMVNTYGFIYQALYNIHDDDELAYGDFPLLFSFGQGVFLIDDTTNFYIRMHHNMPVTQMNDVSVQDRLKIESLDYLFAHDMDNFSPGFLRSAGLQYDTGSFAEVSDRSKWKGIFWEKIREIADLIGTKELERDDPNGPVRYMFVQDEEKTITCNVSVMHYLIPETPAPEVINTSTTKPIDVRRHHMVCVYDTRNQGGETEEDKIQISIKGHPRMNSELADLVEDEDFDPEVLDEPETIPINELRLPNLEEIKQHYFIRDPRPESRTMADLLRKWTKIVNVDDTTEVVEEGNRYPVADRPGYSASYMMNDVPNLLKDLSKHAVEIHRDFLDTTTEDSLGKLIRKYENNMVEFNKNSIRKFINGFFSNTIETLLETAVEEIETARASAVGAISGLVSTIAEALEGSNYQEKKDALNRYSSETLSGNDLVEQHTKNIGERSRIIMNEIVGRNDGEIFNTLLNNYNMGRMDLDHENLIMLTEDTENITEMVDEYGTAICEYDELTYVEKIDGYYKYTVKLLQHSKSQNYMSGAWTGLSDSFKGMGTIDECVLRSKGDKHDLLITSVINIEVDPSDPSNTIVTFMSNTLYDTDNGSVSGVIYDVAVFRGTISNLVTGTHNTYKILSYINYRRVRDNSTTAAHYSIAGSSQPSTLLNPNNTQLIGSYMKVYSPITLQDVPNRKVSTGGDVIIDSMFDSSSGSDWDKQLEIYVDSNDSIEIEGTRIDHLTLTDCRVVIYRSKDRWVNTVWNYLPIYVHVDTDNYIPNKLDSVFNDLYSSGIAYDLSTNLYARELHRMPARDAGLFSEIKSYIQNVDDNSEFKQSYTTINEHLVKIYEDVYTNFLSPFDRLCGYYDALEWDEFYSVDESTIEGDLIPDEEAAVALTNLTLKSVAFNTVRPRIIEMASIAYKHAYYILSLMKEFGIIIEKALELLHAGELIDSTREGLSYSATGAANELKEVFDSIINNNPFNNRPVYSRANRNLYNTVELWKSKINTVRANNDTLRNLTYIPRDDRLDSNLYYSRVSDFLNDYDIPDPVQRTRIVPQALLSRFSSYIKDLVTDSIASIDSAYSLTATVDYTDLPVTVMEMYPDDDDHVLIYRGTVEGHMLLYLYILYYSLYISILEAVITISTRLLQFFCIEEDIDYPGDTFGTMGGLDLVDKREWVELLGASFFHKISDDVPVYPIIPDNGIEMDGGVSIKKHEISNILDYDMPFRYKINIKLPDDLEQELHKVLFKNPNLGWSEDFEEE